MKAFSFRIKRSTTIHVIVWAILFSLPFIFGSHDGRSDPDADAFRIYITGNTAFWMGIFYLNALWITPEFLYKRKYLLYFLLLIVFYALAVLVFFFMHELFLRDKPYIFSKEASWGIVPYIFIIMVSTTYKTIYDRIQADLTAEEKQKENLKTELAFLRSQISPHFLFNVLNNIVSLVRFKSDQLEPTVMKLSSLMQYMLYDTDEEKVLLTDEAEYLQSYIDLQQQRFGAKVKIESTLQVADSAGTIEPMLLIPFVENAFKHGVGLIENPEISVAMHTEKDVLYFSVKNKYNTNTTNDSKDKTSGIGLVNVQRRLELLYGKNYNLTIDKKEGFYTVSLQLKLN